MAKQSEVIQMGLDRKIVRWFSSFGYITLACLCFLLVQGPSAFGQVDQGSITGVVSDPSGAVVPNAKVTLLNTDIGLTLETTTNGSGEYTFSPVRIGQYSVSVSAAGFSTTTQQNLTVAVAQNLQVNVQLKPGAATETVEVTTAPPELQTEDASAGQVINGQSVVNLPLNGRNFTFLAQLGAGVNTPQADTRGNAASGAFSANGLRPAQNNYLLDGIDNNSNAVDFLNGTNFVVLPPPDAISEFKVQTADFSAELGRSAGAVLNATIKSGTNSIHGAAWEFFRNDVLDAADWFRNKLGQKAELRWNQFGVSIGGPIIKNKLFFFGDYEGFRRVQGNTQTGLTVPTLAERNSGYTNLSDIIRRECNGHAANRRPGTIHTGRHDPGSCDNAIGYGGRTVRSRSLRPSTCTSQTHFTRRLPRPESTSCGPDGSERGQAVESFPAAKPTRGPSHSNFVSSPNLFQHSNQFDTRSDFNPSEKNQIFFRFS